MKEKPLSEKSMERNIEFQEYLGGQIFHRKDIAEAVKKLKEDLKECERCTEYPNTIMKIDKIFGDFSQNHSPRKSGVKRKPEVEDTSKKGCEVIRKKYLCRKPAKYIVYHKHKPKEKFLVCKDCIPAYKFIMGTGYGNKESSFVIETCPKCQEKEDEN